MNLFAKKVLEYQQKKLAEAESKLQTHLNKKEQLRDSEDYKEMAKEEKMIEIWSANIIKIKSEIEKIKKKNQS